MVVQGLAVYHVAPIVRAGGKILRGERGGVFGGPWVHFLVHNLCLGMMVQAVRSGSWYRRNCDGWGNCKDGRGL